MSDLHFSVSSVMIYTLLTCTLSAVFALGAAEAAATAASTNGDPRGAHAAGRWWCWGWQWVGCPSSPVTHTVLSCLHLSHAAWETTEPDCTGHQQQTTLHHRWVSLTGTVLKHKRIMFLAATLLLLCSIFNFKLQTESQWFFCCCCCVCRSGVWLADAETSVYMWRQQQPPWACWEDTEHLVSTTGERPEGAVWGTTLGVWTHLTFKIWFYEFYWK